MKTIPTEFSHIKIMIVGDIMLDRYWYGITKRISPEAPVPVVKINAIKDRPGGAANVAMNVASLGANAYLIGLVGMDNEAQILNKTLLDAHVNCRFISVPTNPTITKLRVLSHNQQLIRLDFEKEFKNIDLKLLYKYIAQELNNVGALVLSDYAKGILTNVQDIIALAHEAHVPILIDPKNVNFEKYRGATILTPNFSEFESAVGICKCEKEIIKRGMNLINDLKLSALLITRSKQGMTLLQSGKMPIYMSSQAQEVYDVTGAGDTVIGVLATMIAAGYSLEDACYLANAAAGVVVGKLGTSTIVPIELEQAVRSYYNTNFGIVTEKELKIAVSKARRRGEKIVMTNGVFDILHAGHVSYLTKARNLGDRLIVAVNSDASVKRIKGKMRPVNSLEQRMIVLGALKAVDWVVSFDEDTPQRLIANILPDLLVKGGDYQLNQVIGATEVQANGGKIIVLHSDNGYSTTNIINKIQNSNYK